MALIDLFKVPYNAENEDVLRVVLDDGLAAAQGRKTTVCSGADDLRAQLEIDGKERPDWLDQVDPDLAGVYEDWRAKNLAAIQAITKLAKSHNLGDQAAQESHARGGW